MIELTVERGDAVGVRTHLRSQFDDFGVSLAARWHLSASNDGVRRWSVLSGAGATRL
jgi:hypothetical protein